MNPVKPDIEGWPNVVISGKGAGANDLVAAQNGRDYYTLWEPSFDERQAILDGAKIEIWFTRTMPGFNPMAVSVQGVAEPAPKEGDQP